MVIYSYCKSHIQFCNKLDCLHLHHLTFIQLSTVINMFEAMVFMLIIFTNVYYLIVTINRVVIQYDFPPYHFRVKRIKREHREG